MIEFSIVANPLFYVVAVPAVLSIGIAKAGVGGTGGLATPLMALVVTVPQAAAIMLPIICLADIFAAWAFRKRWHRRNLWIIIPGGAVGVVLGTLGFRFLDEAAIKLVIGVIAVWFAIHFFVGIDRKREERPPTGPHVWKGGFWSVMTGFTSFVAHAGGPPMSVYMIPQRLDKSVYMGTLAFFYAFVNYAKIGPYAWLGVLNLTNLWTSIVLLPVVPLGILLGLWIHRNIPDVVFYRVVVALLFLTGVKLCWDGVQPWIG